MTISETIKILNENKYCGFDNWIVYQYQYELGNEFGVLVGGDPVTTNCKALNCGDAIQIAENIRDEQL